MKFLRTEQTFIVAICCVNTHKSKAVPSACHGYAWQRGSITLLVLVLGSR